MKDNDFYDTKYMGKNDQYISDLIDYITANFHYILELQDEEIRYEYSYHIEANVAVKDKTTYKNLYTYDETLVPVTERASTTTKTEITENLNIDYNKYNDLIKDFIKTYEIDNVTSTLTVNLYVDVKNN